MGTGCRRRWRAIWGVHENVKWVNAKIHFEAVLEWVVICTFGWDSSLFGDKHSGCDPVNLEMLSQIVITRVCWWNWRPQSCQLGSWNLASLEMHLEAMFRWVWRCTWASCDRASLEAVMVRVWWWIWRLWSCELNGWNGATLESHWEAGIEQV